MNNKLISSTKKTNAIFLVIVLIAGTITAISPSFIIGVEAQAQPYYGYNSYESEYADNKYSSYEPQYKMDNNNYKKSYGEDSYGPEHTSKYTDSNSYGPTDYTDKNSYEPTTTSSYGMDDNNYQKTYGKDNGYDQSQYKSSSSTLDYYKPKYQSYDGKDNYKSTKDSSSKSVSLNKIKCINTNLNINGNNSGNVSIGNKGAEEGYLGAYGSDGNGGYDSEGYSKQGKDFDCIINNNNNNNNIAGNQTTPPKATLNVNKNVTCTYEFGAVVPELACELLEDRITENQFLIQLTDDNPVPSQFPGSESGTIVTLGAGNYVISETPDVAAIQADIAYLVQQFEAQSGGTDYTISNPPQVSFTGDCTDVNPNNLRSTEATGTIGAGESQTCNIENHFTITAILS